jgi:hypothetical protein
MATSATEICNYALAVAQATLVEDITVDTSESARQCSALYPLVRDAVLRVHPWNCAIRRKRLTESLTPPEFEFEHAYELPADCLRALLLFDSDYKFKIEGGQLITNDPDAKLLYIAQELDVSKYDPLLVEAIAIKLASRVAASLNNAKSYAASLDQQYRVLLNEARMINGQENSPKKIVQNSGWNTARQGYRSGKNPFTENR